MINRNTYLVPALAFCALSPFMAAPASAAANVYATATTAAITMSSTGGVPTTILALSLPTGSWLVSAKADTVNFSAGDIERCGIKAGATIADQSASSTTPASAVVDINSRAAVVLSSATVVSLFCQHDGSISGEYVDPQASLIAQKVPGIIRQ